MMVLFLLVASFLVVFIAVSVNLLRWAEVYEYFERAKFVICPETGKQANVEVSTTIAAITSLLARPSLRVDHCALWPEKQRCQRECLRQIHVDDRPFLEAARPNH